MKSPIYNKSSSVNNCLMKLKSLKFCNAFLVFLKGRSRENFQTLFFFSETFLRLLPS